MRRLIEWRQTEVTAVYHEKDLLNILIAMTLKLEDHMTGTSQTHQSLPIGTYMDLSFLVYLCVSYSG